jgi:hypothetical protein
MEKSSPARRAGSFEPGRRHASDSQRPGDIGRQMILAHKGRTGEISEKEGFDLRWRAMRVVEALYRRFDGERPQVPIRERAK